MTFTPPEDVARRVAETARGRRLLVLLDFDGTLCEFQPEPQQVWLRRERRMALQQLLTLGRVSAGFVSGRRLSDLRERVGLTGDMWFAGLHGLEIEGFGRRFIHPRVAETRGLLRVLGRALRQHVAHLPGVIVEDKELSIALHVRSASPQHKREASAVFERMATPQVEEGTLRLMPGSDVSELLPNIAWNKGDAALWIRQAEGEIRGAEPVTFYVGDDVTDEDAFKAIGPAGSIMVGPRPSKVETRLENPSAVEQFLRALRDALVKPAETS